MVTKTLDSPTLMIHAFNIAIRFVNNVLAEVQQLTIDGFAQKCCLLLHHVIGGKFANLSRFFQNSNLIAKRSDSNTLELQFGDVHV